jgi:hypothetical protein
MKTIWTLMGLALLIPAISSASPALTVEEPAATTAAPDTVKKGWWVLGMEASNNSSFFGRNTARRYPYVAPSVTYVHRTGIWASVASYQLFDTDDFIDETDVSLGYSFKIRKRLEVDMSYSHFFFSKNNPLVKSATSDALSVRTAYDWKILYTALTSSYLIGTGNDVFTVLENSRYIRLNPLWQGGMPVGLDPKISVTAGTQKFSETHTIMTAQKNQTGGSTGPVGGILDPLKPGGGNTGSPGSGSSGSPTSTTTTTTVSRFRVLNYDLKIPLVVYLGKFEFEPSWRYSIPVNQLEGDESEAQSFYNLSVKYTF